MAGLQYIRAGDNILYGASVSTTAGTTDSTYTDDWLCDGRSRPARATSGTVTWAATGTASGEVGVVIPHSHNIDPSRTITIGGGVSGTGAGPALRTNGIPVNPWIQIGTPASTASVSIAITGNTVDVVIGELLAGKLRELTSSFLIDSFEWGYLEVGKVPRQSEGGSVPNYDRGLVARWLRGTLICDATDRDDLEAWEESERHDSRPSALIPFSDRQDAWVGKVESIQLRRFEHIYQATLSFHEWPRKRWA